MQVVERFRPRSDEKTEEEPLLWGASPRHPRLGARTGVSNSYLGVVLIGFFPTALSKCPRVSPDASPPLIPHL